jgi:hypothetical protein
MRRTLAIMGALAVMASAEGASAQLAAPVCTQGKAVLPPELAAWSSTVPKQAAKDAKTIATATLMPGQAVTAALFRTADLHYVVRPEKPGGSVSFGGLFRFAVKEAGTYRIALGSGAWIDVLKGKTAVESIAHGHGPECSDIRKMVDFSLKPGRYALQISANGGNSLPLLVTRVP